MNWIAMQPWRKPITVLSVFFTLALIAWTMYTGTDIPGGVVTVLIAFNGFTIGGYFGSSAYEAVRPHKRAREIREEFPPPPGEGETS